MQRAMNYPHSAKDGMPAKYRPDEQELGKAEKNERLRGSWKKLSSKGKKRRGRKSKRR